MRYGADQLSVLQDWAAGHALHDAARPFDQALVGHGQKQVSPALRAGIDPVDAHRIALDAAALDIREDLGFTRARLLRSGHRNPLFLRHLFHDAEQSLFAVLQNRAGRSGDIEFSLQRAGRASGALFDGGDAGFHQKTGRHRKKLRLPRLVDAVAQRAEHVRLRIIEGHGADASNAVAQAGAQAVPVPRPPGRDKELRLFPVPQHRKRQRSARPDNLPQLLQRIQFLSVGLQARVSLPQAGLLRRHIVFCLRDDKSLRIQLDADCTAAGNHASGRGRQSLYAPDQRQQNAGCRF